MPHPVCAREIRAHNDRSTKAALAATILSAVAIMHQFDPNAHAWGYTPDRIEGDALIAKYYSGGHATPNTGMWLVCAFCRFFTPARMRKG